CKGVTTQLTATSSVPGTFQWNQSAGTGPVVSVMPDTTTTYTVTFSYGAGCQRVDSVTVQVAGEIAPVVFPTDLSLCPGESVQLNSLVIPGATYAWSSNPAGFSSTLATPVVSPTQTTQYTVVSTLGNCVNSRTVQVIVFNDVTLAVSNDTMVCAGESVKLFANGSASGTYKWTPGAGTGSPFLVHTNPQQASSTYYQVVYTYGDGCTLTDSVQVKAIASFDVVILATPDTNRINLGESIELFAKVAPSQSLNGFTYNWSENNSHLSQNTEKITVKPESNDSTVTYQVEVISPAGCRQIATLTFRLVQPLVRFPNAFTPNGDQVNSSFKMLVLEGFATVERMEIYNRWGQKVFESTDPAAAWDGQVDGKDAASDVYACVVRWRRGDGALQIYVGEITLLR
ncbi:MAG: gliding motility-associated C-terminal domain-containing protein, partial [Saprospiraceae bacterium]